MSKRLMAYVRKPVVVQNHQGEVCKIIAKLSNAKSLDLNANVYQSIYAH